MTLACDSRLEADFQYAVTPYLDKLEVEVERLHHNERTDVLEVLLRLPSPADRALRREVLQRLVDFEHESDHAFIVDPTLIWGDADED